MTPIQMEFAIGKRLRDNGIDSVEANNLTWVERMRNKAREISNTRGKVSINEIREYVRETGLMPDHHNAFGSIFREKGWEHVGYTKATTATAHARIVGEWRWCDGRRKAA